RTLSVRPRGSGDPESKGTRPWPPGSPLPRRRTERLRDCVHAGYARPARPEQLHPHYIFNYQTAHAIASPDLASGAGGPVSFPSPHEGSGAPRRRMAWISPDRPVFHGRARNAGSLAHMTRAPASSRRATRHLSAFAFSASRTEPAVLSAAGRLPECRPR